MTAEDLRHRAILAIDMEGSTTRTNPTKATLRSTMYDMFDDALRSGGITKHHRDPLVDRGDGILALIHPTDTVPKTKLLNTVIRRLATRLADQDGKLPTRRLRLRAVVHAGEVHYDQQGCFGESLDIAFRLLDAPEVKANLQQTKTPLSVVVSDEIYQSIVRHGYPGITEQNYKQAVHICIAGRAHHGWLQQSATLIDPVSTVERNHI
jgi:class 3 adenylate cyclase